MTRLATLTSTAALLLAGLALAGVPAARAQEEQGAAPEQHHPADPGLSEPGAPAGAGGPTPGMMGMMSPEMMEHMREMMQHGMPMMPGMMGGPGGMAGRGTTMQPAPGVTIIINTHGMHPLHGAMMMGGQDGGGPPMMGQGMMGGGMMGQGMMGGEGMMGPQGMPGAAAAGPATMAYRQAVMRMHQGMNVALTGDPDADFARLMIPHHQSAIAMAQVALREGKDPQIRALAQEVVEAQERETATLRDWLAKNPGR